MVFIAHAGTRRNQDQVSFCPDTLPDIGYSCRSNDSPLRHLLCHEQHQSQVISFHAAEQATELSKQACVFALVAPFNIGTGLALRKIRQLGRMLSIIEELVHWDFKGAGELLQRLDGRNCVSVLDARNITTEQPSALFNFALREFPFLAQFTQTVAGNHVCRRLQLKLWVVWRRVSSSVEMR